MQNPSTFDCECDKVCKIDKYLDIQNSSCKNVYFVITCEDETLNTTEISHFDKKVTCEKNSCLIYTISLVISYTYCHQLPFLLVAATTTQIVGQKKNIHYCNNIKSIA